MYTTCNIEFQDLDLWYYNPDGLERWGVLANIMCKDSHNNTVINFTTPRGGKTCSHVHCFEPEVGVSVMKVANRKVDPGDTEFWAMENNPHREFALVVLVSNGVATCLYLEQNENAFKDINDLIAILRNGLNQKLSSHKLAIKTSKTATDHPDDVAAVCAAVYVGKQLNKALTMAEALNNCPKLAERKKKLPSENKNLRDAIIDQSKAGVILSNIDKYMKGKKEPKDIMMPTTAFIAAAKMRPPTWKEYRNTYPHVKLSEKSFYRLRDPENKAYKTAAFNKMVEEFEKV